MNELLQKHGCSNVFHVPEGLKELMSDISREVLRIQPKRLNEFIANYLSALLITREHGIMATKILEDLCDCQPSVSEHLINLGLCQDTAESISKIIKQEIEESPEPVEGKEKIKEYLIIKKILATMPLDEQMAANVCHIVRCAYKDYWYRKNLLKQSIKVSEEEPWEIAVRNTLNLYKKTKPSLTELSRATQRIQAAYRGYHVRRHVLRHLLPKKDKRQGRKVDLGGPPLDIAGARDVNLGPVINIRTAVKEDDVNEMFEKETAAKLGIQYDHMKTLPAPPADRVPKPAGLSFAKGEKFSDGPSIPRSDNKQNFAAGRISFSEIPPEIISEKEMENRTKLRNKPAIKMRAAADTTKEDSYGDTKGSDTEAVSDVATDAEGMIDSDGPTDATDTGDDVDTAASDVEE